MRDTYKNSILYNPEYHEWWPRLTSNQENKRKRLVREYGKAFWNVCYNAAPGKSIRRHIYWLGVVSKLDKRLDKICKAK